MQGNWLVSFEDREYVAFCSPDGENAVAAAIEGDSSPYLVMAQQPNIVE